jgi:hypothetical protein
MRTFRILETTQTTREYYVEADTWEKAETLVRQGLVTWDTVIESEPEIDWDGAGEEETY